VISNSKTSKELKQAALSEGMRTLRTVGLSKVSEGITTLEEVIRETRAR
jgi:type IV pilus assembly protein PilB